MQDHFKKIIEKSPITLAKGISSELIFWVKREDKSLLGSHKHFGVKKQFETLKQNGVTHAVISTSGNAGITAGYFAKKNDVDLTVIMSEKSPIEKISAVQKSAGQLYISSRPARLANYLGAKHNFYNLRPSLDPVAIDGFKDLAYEIFEQYKELNKSGEINEFWSEIYTFYTSGASYIGIKNGFEELVKKGELTHMPKLHGVYGDAGNFGIKRSNLEKRIQEVAKQTGGSLIEIKAKDIEKLQLKKEFETFSGESISTFAAAMKNDADSSSLVISTGKNWKTDSKNTLDKASLPKLETFEDCDRLAFKKKTKEVRGLLENYIVIYVGKDGTRAIGLEHYIPNFSIICGQLSDAMQKAKEDGIQILFIDENIPSSKILEHEKAAKYIRDFTKEVDPNNEKQVAILTFKSNSKIEFICKKNGYISLNLDARLATNLEEKSEFEHYIEGYGGPILETYSGKLQDIELDQITKKNKGIDRLALQFTHGFAGQTTHFIQLDTFEEFKELHGERKVKVTPFIKGPTLTLNGCIFKNEVLLSSLFLQKTGDPLFTRHAGGSCGVYFDQKELLKVTSNEMLKKAHEIAIKLGERFKEKGLKGYFGFDLITNQNEVYPIELNPRFTATMHPFTELQTHNNVIPFAILHILEFLNLKIQVNKNTYLHKLKGQTTALRNVTDSEKTVGQLHKKSQTQTGHRYSDLLLAKTNLTYNLAQDTTLIKPDERYGERYEI